MATETKTQNQPSPRVVEGKWLQFRRRFTTTIIVFKDIGLELRAEYARTNIEFSKEKGEWNWNWLEEEVRSPHAKSEKRYFETDEGSVWIENGDLECKVTMELPDEPCIVIQRTARKRGWNDCVVDEEVTMYGDVQGLFDNVDAVSGVTYPIKNVLWNAGFRWNSSAHAYIRA